MECDVVEITDLGFVQALPWFCVCVAMDIHIMKKLVISDFTPISAKRR